MDLLNILTDHNQTVPGIGSLCTRHSVQSIKHAKLVDEVWFISLYGYNYMCVLQLHERVHVRDVLL